MAPLHGKSLQGMYTATFPTWNLGRFIGLTRSSPSETWLPQGNKEVFIFLILLIIKDSDLDTLPETQKQEKHNHIHIFSQFFKGSEYVQ